MHKYKLSLNVSNPGLYLVILSVKQLVKSELKCTIFNSKLLNKYNTKIIEIWHRRTIGDDRNSSVSQYNIQDGGQNAKFGVLYFKVT